MRGNGDLAGKKQGGYPLRYLRHVEYNLRSPCEDGRMAVYKTATASRFSLTARHKQDSRILELHDLGEGGK